MLVKTHMGFLGVHSFLIFWSVAVETLSIHNSFSYKRTTTTGGYVSCDYHVTMGWLGVVTHLKGAYQVVDILLQSCLLVKWESGAESLLPLLTIQLLNSEQVNGGSNT